MSETTVVRTTVSLPPQVLEKGRAIAKRRVRNFSSYIADLILSDAAELATEKQANGRKAVKA